MATQEQNEEPSILSETKTAYFNLVKLVNDIFPSYTPIERSSSIWNEYKNNIKPETKVSRYYYGQAKYFCKFMFDSKLSNLKDALENLSIHITEKNDLIGPVDKKIILFCLSIANHRLLN